MNPDVRLANLSPVSSRAFYLRATSREHDDADADLTSMLRYLEGSWANYEIEAAVVAHSAFESNGRHVFSLTPFGDVHVASPTGFRWEKLDSDLSSSPNRLRHMRDMRRVGESLFAVGMGRMAYERSPGGLWAKIDAGMRKQVVGGLLSVDGSDRSNVYACGFGGEIWRFDGDAWHAVDSPTNVKLEQVRTLSSDKVALCGAGGTLLIGNNNGWRTLNPTASEMTLWGLAHFEGRVYAADSAQIYVVDGEDLKPIALPFDRPVSTGRLQATEGVLWSIGENDLCTFDGSNWRIIDYP